MDILKKENNNMNNNKKRNLAIKRYKKADESIQNNDHFTILGKTVKVKTSLSSQDGKSISKVIKQEIVPEVSKTEKYLVLVKYNKDEDYNNEYNLIVTIMSNGDKEYSLFSNNNNVWTENYKNKKIISMLDDGNGISITFIEKNDLNKLNYSQAESIRIILNYVRKKESSNILYKIIENKEENFVII